MLLVTMFYGNHLQYHESAQVKKEDARLIQEDDVSPVWAKLNMQPTTCRATTDFWTENYSVQDLLESLITQSMIL